MIRKCRLFFRYLWNVMAVRRWFGSKVISWNEAVRIYPRWVATMEKGFTPISLELPWIALPAIKFLEGVLTPSMKVLEYGSGGSTLFFARRVKEVVSIEHNAAWAAQVRDALLRERLAHARVEVIKPVPESSEPAANPSDPFRYDSGESRYRGLSFRDYACRADDFPDGYFDLILVDGRSRPACLRHAIPKIRAGGYLLLDNAERDYYLKSADQPPPDWIRRNFMGAVPCQTHFNMTSVWQAPE